MSGNEVSPEAEGTSVTEVSQHVDASRAAVYRACLDPVALTQWRVPDIMDAEVHEFDARPGGRFRMSLTYRDPARAGKTAGATDTFRGRFAELDPDRRIVEVIEFDSADPGFAGQMTMTTTLADDGDGTRVTVRAEGIPAGVRRQDNVEGTLQSLRKLAALLAGQGGG
jgi:uncharacterized protein YndB with AHSA1/START domain